MTAPEGLPAKKPGPRLLIGIAVMLLGTAMGIGGLAAGIADVVHNVRGPHAVIPADITSHLDTGTWQVYVDQRALIFLNPTEVTVSGPNGQHPVVSETSPTKTETLNSDGISYTAELKFDVTTPGEYQVHVSGPAGYHIVLARSFGSIARHAAGWFVLMGFGILVGVVGLVLTIVGVARRSRARRGTARPPGGYYPPGGYAAASPAGGPPPGWYPDPSIPGTTRWWDGTRWTDQTHTE